MSRESLSLRLLRSEGIAAVMSRVYVKALAREFPALEVPTLEQDPPAARRMMLTWGSLFAAQAGAEAQEAALRIALDVLFDGDRTDREREAAELLLARMSNAPMRDLARRRGLLSAPDRDDGALPLPLYMETMWRGLADTITLPSGDLVNANQFQRELWDALSVSQIVSASAPTSVGKSFIVMRWIGEFARASAPGTAIVYLAPTRALVAEIETSLSGYVSKLGIRGVWVSSVPSLPPSGVSVEILVLTQERYHLVLRSRGAAWAPDLVVVDEAQKVGDGRRGVLLQHVLGSTIRRNASCQLAMVSPSVANPEELLSIGGARIARQPVARGDVTVVQNLIWADAVKGRPRQWTLHGFMRGIRIPVGSLQLAEDPGDDRTRLTKIAKALAGDAPGNVVYANGAVEAEMYASQLADAQSANLSPAQLAALRDVVALVRDAVHPRYSLADLLSKGVGYHYGNMPTIVRAEVERLFRENVIRWLVCTSTLMEGVNLPCRNLFLRGPRKGRTKPMDAVDFWNLAGRAGRWGVEFAGNVVCVDASRKSVWKTPPPTSRSAHRIQAAVASRLANPHEFFEYLNSGAPPAGEGTNSENEALFSYLAACILRQEALDSLPWLQHVGSATLREAEDRVRATLTPLALPPELLERNPGVSPVGLCTLLARFRSAGQLIAIMLPARPEDADAVDGFAALMGHCDQHFGPVFGGEGHRTGVAIVTVNWMRGRTLRSIIDDRIDYFKRRGNSVKIGLEIRTVLEMVEGDARYRVPKYVGAYCEVLRYYLQHERGDEALASAVPDFSQSLEFGVSQKTHLSLMMLGISRYSAIKLSNYTPSTEMSAQDCLRWLSAFDADAYALPSVVAREIDSVLATKTELLASERNS